MYRRAQVLCPAILAVALAAGGAAAQDTRFDLRTEFRLTVTPGVRTVQIEHDLRVNGRPSRRLVRAGDGAPTSTGGSIAGRLGDATETFAGSSRPVNGRVVGRVRRNGVLYDVVETPGGPAGTLRGASIVQIHGFPTARGIRIQARVVRTIVNVLNAGDETARRLVVGFIPRFRNDFGGSVQRYIAGLDGTVWRFTPQEMRTLFHEAPATVPRAAKLRLFGKEYPYRFNVTSRRVRVIDMPLGR